MKIYFEIAAHLSDVDRRRLDFLPGMDARLHWGIYGIRKQHLLVHVGDSLAVLPVLQYVWNVGQ